MRLMESTLCVLAFTAIILVLIAARHCTPQDPASIARIVALIAESQALTHALSSTGSWPLKDLKTLLQGVYTARFRTAVDSRNNKWPDFVIESERLGNQQPSDR